MQTETLFYLICAAAAVVMLMYYLRRSRRVGSFIFGAVSGLLVLFLFNKYGYIAGVTIPLNAFNVCGSAILGIPFVALLIIINFL